VFVDSHYNWYNIATYHFIHMTDWVEWENWYECTSQMVDAKWSFSSRM
jgi:hypothetical protein